MVTRCVCCDITFTDLLRIARLHNTNSVGKLHEVAQFGEGCGLCLPYVSLMLRTGRVSFAPSEPFETVALSDESAVASPNEPLSAPQQHRDG